MRTMWMAMAVCVLGAGCAAFADVASVAADLAGSLATNPGFIDAVGNASGTGTAEIALWSGAVAAGLRLLSKFGERWGKKAMKMDGLSV